MKKLSMLAILMALLLSGCSSSAPAEPETPKKTYKIDNLVISYPDEESYEISETGEGTFYDITNISEGIRISISRFEITDENYDPIADLRSLASAESVKEENGITYAQPDPDVIIRILNNDYYSYLLIGGPYLVEETEELMQKVKDIVFSAAIDPSIAVEDPHKSDTFIFKSLQIETPVELMFQEFEGDYDFGIMAQDGSLLLFINNMSIDEFSQSGYDLTDIQEAVYKDREVFDLGNGFSYCEYPYTTESGNEYNYIYSLMNDKESIYDVYILMRMSDKERYRAVALDILKNIKVS